MDCGSKQLTPSWHSRFDTFFSQWCGTPPGQPHCPHDFRQQIAPLLDLLAMPVPGHADALAPSGIMMSLPPVPLSLSDLLPSSRGDRAWSVPAKKPRRFPPTFPMLGPSLSWSSDQFQYKAAQKRRAAFAPCSSHPPVSPNGTGFSPGVGQACQTWSVPQSLPTMIFQSPKRAAVIGQFPRLWLK